MQAPTDREKSSVIKRFEFEGRHNLLDTDAIAKRLNPNNPALSAIAAGREVIRRTHEYIEMGESFAIETTLAGSFIYDNSGAEPRKVLETRAGVIIRQAVDQPSWVTSLIENLS